MHFTLFPLAFTSILRIAVHMLDCMRYYELLCVNRAPPGMQFTMFSLACTSILRIAVHMLDCMRCYALIIR